MREPRLTDLHDPWLLNGMEAAAGRIVAALKAGERIVIYGDYDVDGVTATAILFHVLREISPGANVGWYVPHRLEEGYGLNSEALRQLKREGAGLVISVDCGVSAVEEARVAREIGLDLIITDHHNASAGAGGIEELPGATAVVHPRVARSTYPFGELCGAGVAYKVAWGVCVKWCGSERVSKNLQEKLVAMLPLAALGTIADVVPLVGENRVLAWWGLRGIKQTPLAGLRALIEASDLMGEKIDSHKVGFVLGPRLNACGRMGHAAEAVRMLTDAGEEEAGQIARKLTAMNAERQNVERRIAEQAARMAEERGMTRDDCRVIVLAHEEWHAGVVGIVCSRLAERFGRPTVLMQKNGEVCKGSARSIEGYSIYEGLCAVSEHLKSYGGHDAAGGLSVEVGKLEAFSEALRKHANERITKEQLTASITIDCDARADELDVAVVRAIQKLAPFGRGHEVPVVRIGGLTLAEAPKQMGANGRHLMMRLRDEGGRWMRAVWWGEGGRGMDLAAGMRVDIAAAAVINEFNGRVSVEAEIRDVRVREK